MANIQQGDYKNSSKGIQISQMQKDKLMAWKDGLVDRLRLSCQLENLSDKEFKQGFSEVAKAITPD